MQAFEQPTTAASVSPRSARFCSGCGSDRLIRVARVSYTDLLVSQAGLFPYVCRRCKRRTLRPDMGRVFLLALIAALILGLGSYAWRLRRESRYIASVAPTPSPVAEKSAEVLTNQDIARMQRAGLPPSVIVRLIAARPNDFQIDSVSLIRLKQSGVPDELILDMVAAALERPAAPHKEAPRAPSAPVALTARTD